MKKIILIICVLIGVISNAQIPSYIPSNGLLLYYPLDNNGNDLSGYNNHLTTNGNVGYTSNSNGMSNSASHFPNGNDYFLTPTSTWSLVNNLAQGSVSFWVKIDSQYVSGHYFEIGNSFIVKQKHGVGEDLFFGMQDASTKIRMQITGSFPSSPGIDVVGNTPLNPNVWYHVIGVWDGTYHRLYLNGVLDAQINNSSGTADRPLPDYFSIGSVLYGGNGSLNYPSGTYGSLDDIGIWNRALTEQEILALYQGCQMSITTQPTNQSVNLSTGNTSFNVVTNATNPTFQWQTNLGVGFQNLSNVGQCSGVNTASLTVSNLTLTNDNQAFRCIISEGGCVDTSGIATLSIIDDASINSQHETSLVLSPNPITNSFSISGIEQIVSLTLKDLNGKWIKSFDAQDKNHSMSNVSSGVYFLEVRDENRSYIIKVVKE